MGILVIAEHDNSELKPATRVAISAAAKIGGDIDVLVAGAGCAAVGAAAAAVPGVRKVLVADNAVYAHDLAENLALLAATSGRATAMC